jgi:energy-coupling factor transporter ATP-binding protein EcfA2
MDEPLTGQDGPTQMRMIHWLKDYRQKGGALILGTNNAFLIEQLATTIYELDAMRLLPVEELPQPEEKVMRLEFATTPRSLALPAALQQLALKITDGSRRVIVYANVHQSDALIEAMLKNGFSLRGLRYEVL